MIEALIDIGDIVRLSNNQELIVTGLNPQRPVHKYTGVKAKGQGTEYKFGDAFKPVIIGKADPNHPALVALKRKKAAKTPSYWSDRDNSIKGYISDLDGLIDGGNDALAQTLTPIRDLLKTLVQ